MLITRSSMLLQMALFHCFWWPSNIPYYIYMCVPCRRILHCWATGEAPLVSAWEIEAGFYSLISRDKRSSECYFRLEKKTQFTKECTLVLSFYAEIAQSHTLWSKVVRCTGRSGLVQPSSGRYTTLTDTRRSVKQKRIEKTRLTSLTRRV